MHIHISKRVLSIIVVLILVITIPIVLYALSQNQDVRQRASETGGTEGNLAVVDNEPITQQDLNSYLETVYDTPPDDANSRNIALNELIQNKVIRNTAKQNKLTASAPEIELQMSIEGTGGYKDNAFLREKAEIAVLKRKIEKKFTKGRDAYTVGFWIPPQNYSVTPTQDQLDTIDQQRLDKDEALAEIEKGLSDGKTPSEVANGILEKYPSLEGILAINGRLVAKTENKDLIEKPLFYSYQAGRNDLEFFKTLFELTEDQVSTAINETTNDGGIVIKVVGVYDGQYDNYSTWYQAQKKDRVYIVK